MSTSPFLWRERVKDGYVSVAILNYADYALRRNEMSAKGRSAAAIIKEYNEIISADPKALFCTVLESKQNDGYALTFCFALLRRAKRISPDVTCLRPHLISKAMTLGEVVKRWKLTPIQTAF